MIEIKCEKLKQLIDIISLLIIDKFSGSIEIHFSQGGIAKVIKRENINI